MILRALLDTIFPPLCHGCRQFIPAAGAVHLCDECRAGSRAIASPCCCVCGTPFLTEAGRDHRCGACISAPPPFDGARSAVLFEGAARDLIHRLKYGGKVQHSRPLALLVVEHLADYIAACRVDLVVPVPLHVKRLRERGFNQAVLLGEIIARQWRMPLCRTNLRRSRWTEPQVGMTAAERAGNVRGAFSLADRGTMTGRRILLVDDVFTTGSTVAECARTLKKGGVEAVYSVTVARATVP